MVIYRHGERTISGIGRWCAKHGIVHGYLYSCEFYSEELLAEIRELDRKRKVGLAASFALVIIFAVLLAVI